MNVGARELIWLLIALLVVYVLVQLLRLRSVRRIAPAKQGESAAAALPEGAAAATPEAAPAPGIEDALPAAARDEVRERAERIALELEVQQLRRDIGQLRSELDSQRREAARLATELGELRDTVAGVEATQRVSPQYNEAVMLARRGLSAEAVAERCGISVAEAALVRSMIQREGQQGEDA